jgi:hypothetical protein
VTYYRNRMWREMAPSGVAERSVVKKGCKGDMATCRSKEEEPWDGSEIIILFQEVVSYL